MAALRGNFNFTPTVLPLAGSPKEEFSQLMDSRIAAFDEGVASENLTTGTLAALDVASGNEVFRNQIATDAETELKALAEEFQGAYENPQFRMRQSALIRKLVKNPDLNTLNINKRRFDVVEEMKIKNPNGLDFNPFAEHAARDQEAGKVSLFEPGYEPRQEYIPALDLALKPIVSYIKNGNTTFTITTPDENGTPFYLMKTKSGTKFNIQHAVDGSGNAEQTAAAKEMLLLIENQALPTFLQTSAGDQLKRGLGAGLIEPSSSEDPDEEILARLIDRMPAVNTEEQKLQSFGAGPQPKGGGGDKIPRSDTNLDVVSRTYYEDVPDNPIQVSAEATKNLKTPGENAAKATIKTAYDYTPGIDGSGDVKVTLDDGSILVGNAAKEVIIREHSATDAYNRSNSGDYEIVTRSLEKAGIFPGRVNPKANDYEVEFHKAIFDQLYKDVNGNYSDEITEEVKIEMSALAGTSQVSSVPGVINMNTDDAGDAGMGVKEYINSMPAESFKKYIDTSPEYVAALETYNELTSAALKHEIVNLPKMLANTIGASKEERSIMDREINEGLNKGKHDFTYYPINITEDQQGGKGYTLETMEEFWGEGYTVEYTSLMTAGAPKIDSSESSNFGKLTNVPNPDAGTIEINLVHTDPKKKTYKMQVIGTNADRFIREKIGPTQRHYDAARAMTSNIIYNDANDGRKTAPGIKIKLTANEVAKFMPWDDSNGTPHIDYVDYFGKMLAMGQAATPKATNANTVPDTDLMGIYVEKFPKSDRLLEPSYGVYYRYKGQYVPLPTIEGESNLIPLSEEAPDTMERRISRYFRILYNKYVVKFDNANPSGQQE